MNLYIYYLCILTFTPFGHLHSYNVQGNETAPSKCDAMDLGF